MDEIKINKETENEVRALITKQEALAEVLLRQGIDVDTDPSSMLLTANFFFYVEDYGKWLEYNDKIMTKFPYSKECMIVGKNLRYVKENCIVK